jgi:hypothetical protein
MLGTAASKYLPILDDDERFDGRGAKIESE